MVKELLPFFIKPSRSAASQSPPNLHQVAETLSRCSSAQARRLLDYEQAEKLNVLPLGLITFSDGEVLSVAAEKDYSPDLEASLRFITGREVKLLAVDKAALKEAIFFAYRGDDTNLIKVFGGIPKVEDIGNNKDHFVIEFRPENGEAAKCLSALIDYAVSKGASDIHMIPLADSALIRLRINGELYSSEKTVVTKAFLSQMLSRLKVLARLDTTNRHTPQDGGFSFPVSERPVHARVSFMPTVHGEKAVLRLLGVKGVINLDELGFDAKWLSIIKSTADKRGGLILFCGPTGSGKSTSMYAVLNYLRSKNLNIVSIEDPVEVYLDGASQTSIKEEIGLSYPACLRSVLRQDPDVLLIGEIRDKESAEIAMQAALTGHLLLSTVHARDVFEVFLRLRYLGIDDLTISQAIVLLLNQRLVPMLCKKCKVFDLVGSNRKHFDIYKPVGCSLCDYSGYSGRLPGAEFLRIDEPLRAKLQAGLFIKKDLEEALNETNYYSINQSLDILLREGCVALKDWVEIG